MASDRQIAANRLNALKSTGPRTPEGKARAALNHLKTGILATAAVIPGENPEALQELAGRCDWRSRRFARAEAQMWADGMEGPLRRQETNPTGTGFTNRSNTLERLDRCIDRNQRVYIRARRELGLLQRTGPAAHGTRCPNPGIGFERQIRISPGSRPACEIGFERRNRISTGSQPASRNWV